MSDQFDSLFDGLRGQPAPTPFAPADAVRRRGRQRSHRQAAAVGLAVLAVTGLGAGGLATAVPQPDAQPPPPPAATGTETPPPEPTAPSPTPSPRQERTDPPPQEPEPPPRSSDAPDDPDDGTIPEDWLLVPADLGGDGWQQTGNEMLEGAWYWDGAEAWCPEYRTEDYPSVQQRIDVATVSWRRQAALPERVDQLVERFGGGAAATNIDDVRAYVELCSREPSEGDEVAPTEYAIEDSGFAGDQSLLIRVQDYHFNEDDEIEPAGEYHYVAVVRVGDAVTTIVYRAGGEVHQVAQNAAARIQ